MIDTKMGFRHDMIKPVINERALIINDILVVGDLHLGLEHELKNKGIIIKSQWGDTRRRLLDLIKEQKVKKLVLLGDLKHNIPKASAQEYKNLPILLENLSKTCEVIIIKGNHDGLLEELLGDSFEVLKSKDIDGALFAHGHMNIDLRGYKYVIFGHNHPSLQLSDELGYGVREPAWVRLKLNESGLEHFGLTKSPFIIIVPAFNKLLPGNPINSKGKLLGPLFNKKLVDIGEAEISLLDGTSLGLLKDLKQGNETDKSN